MTSLFPGLLGGSGDGWKAGDSCQGYCVAMKRGAPGRGNGPQTGEKHRLERSGAAHTPESSPEASAGSKPVVLIGWTLAGAIFLIVAAGGSAHPEPDWVFKLARRRLRGVGASPERGHV